MEAVEGEHVPGLTRPNVQAASQNRWLPMTSPDTQASGPPKPPAPLWTRPPEELLAKKWEELTPEDHAKLEAYTREMLAHLSGS